MCELATVKSFEIDSLDKGLTSLKRQLSILFTVANSHYQPSWKNQII